MMKKLAHFSPYLVFLSLPLIALTKGKGTVILLGILFLGLLSQYRPTPSVWVKAKDYKHPLFWTIVLLAWCGLSIFWTEASWLEIATRYMRLIALMTMGSIAYIQLRVSSAEMHQHFYKAFTWGYVLFAGFYMLEISTDGIFFYLLEIAKGRDRLDNPGFSYNQNALLRGIVILSLWFWPYIYTYRKKAIQLCVILAFLWLINGLSPDAAFLGMIVASLLYLIPARAQKILLSSILLGGILTPWISTYLLNERTLFDYMRFIPTSHQHRIFMWEELSNFIFQKPFLGYGFDFSSFIKSPKLLCNHYTMDVLQERFPHIMPMLIYPGGAKLCDGTLLFGIHPHNGFLQLWLEVGGIGVLLFSIFAILFYRSIQENRVAVAMLGFYAAIFSISFNLWQNWMISTLWLGAMCLFVVNHRQKDDISKEKVHVST